MVLKLPCMSGCSLPICPPHLSSECTVLSFHMRDGKALQIGLVRHHCHDIKEEEASVVNGNQPCAAPMAMCAWLDEGTHHCGRALMFHASNVQREAMGGAVNGVPPSKIDSSSMGSQDLANFILWPIEDNQLPRDIVSHIQAGAQEDLTAQDA